MSCPPPGAEPDVSYRDPASGKLSVDQQAGEGTAAADDWDQSAESQEQVESSHYWVTDS